MQTAAVTAVGMVRPQAAVQKLIDLMRKAGRMRTECADALFKITGLDFGVDPDRWQAQWTKLMSIEGWRIPTDEGAGPEGRPRRKNDEFYGKKRKADVVRQHSDDVGQCAVHHRCLGLDG
ncbi:MAG: hypothetical protein IPK26_23980 [Planctomycetes bacterium]|nr:hypothetical protein [Planctomycetota bacterium]